MANVRFKFSQNNDLRNAEVVLVDEQQARPLDGFEDGRFGGQNPRHLVAVIGAGPAGLFAAKQLASEGVQVALLNRDVKPGGLAEYGIYPDKHRMKEGLRQQFRQILSHPSIQYYGNVNVGRSADLSLDDLQALGCQALLVTVGAQGTKWLGLPGEELTGVYHAKDIVYHYNRLPPFSERRFAIGRRVAVVGVGNVMLDIAHWLIQDRKVDEVIALARRGPGEIKYTRTELEYVAANLDRDDFSAELRRVGPLMESLGQNPQDAQTLVEGALQRAAVTHSPTRFRLRFLGSPARILGDERGHVSGLEVETNTLVKTDDGRIKPVSLGQTQVLDVDTVIFAIGDRVDETFGLPVAGNEFVKNPDPCYPIDGASFEAFDPVRRIPLDGIFVAGWSRQASAGLVGVARKDGTNGARAVLQHLAAKPAGDLDAHRRLHERLAGLANPVVTQADLARLEAAERQKSADLNLLEFKFTSNHEMLVAMGLVVKN